jgi:hypothetical protein
MKAGFIFVFRIERLESVLVNCVVILLQIAYMKYFEGMPQQVTNCKSPRLYIVMRALRCSQRSNVTGCDAVSTGKRLLVFRSNVVPRPSWSTSPRKLWRWRHNANPKHEWLLTGRHDTTIRKTSVFALLILCEHLPCSTLIRQITLSRSELAHIFEILNWIHHLLSTDQK